MRRFVARVAVGLCGLIAAATFVIVPTASGATFAQTSGCDGGWSEQAVPSSLAALQPQGLATLGGTPAWIVGLASATSTTKRAPLIGQWVNGAWQKSASPWTNYGALDAVAATSPTNAWTVGSIGSYVRWPIVAHWNGSAWQNVSPRKPNGQSAILTGVAVIDNNRMWASGVRQASGLNKPLMLMHNAQGWKTLSPSVVGSAQGGLTDAAIDSNGRVWAAGWKTDGTGQVRPWITFRRNSSWIDSPLASVAAGRGSIMRLQFVSATDGWAAGWLETVSGYTPILQHWDGSKWSNVSTPWASGRSIILNGVSEDPSGSLTVAAMQVDLERTAIVAKRVGTSWTSVDLGSGPNEPTSTMLDAAPLAGGSIAAGYVLGYPEIVVPCASAKATIAETTENSTQPSTSSLDDNDAPDTIVPTDNFSRASQPVRGVQAVDMTQQAGLAYSVPTWGGTVADFNGDGSPDVFINLHDLAQPMMMLNSSNHVFAPEDQQLIKRDRHDCSAADVNHDGSIDLFCAVGTSKGTTASSDELTLNPGNNGGTWASRQFGVMDAFGRGRSATFLNLNGDAYPDLYVVNEVTRSDGVSTSNRLYINNAGHGFVPAPSWGVDLTIGGSCPRAADLNGDGLDELLLCSTEPNGGLPYGARVYLNTGSAFSDETAALGLLISGVTDMAVADFNHDGKPDIAQLTTTGLDVMLNNGQTFSNGYALDFNGGVALATGDVNGDGRPDIYVARRVKGNAGNLMLVNDGDGTSFTSMTIPEPGAGKADTVLALDYDGNGLTDFITLNGWTNVLGPINLTAFFPN